MNMETGNRKHATLWLWAVVAVIAVAGASGAAVAKERTKQGSKEKTTTQTPGGETGNGSGPGYIGVYMQDLTSQVKKGLDIKVEKGVLVSGVEEDSPADKAGIEDGDVITRFNGKSVASADELRDAVRAVAPGKDAKIDVVHEGNTKSLTLTVSERPEREAMHWQSFGDGDSDAPMAMARAFTMMGGPRLGVEARPLEDDGLASYFGAKKGDGLLVLSVDDESVAGKAGVKPGDIISKVGTDKIEDTQDVRHALKDYDKGDQFDITVIRHGKSQSLKATMDEQDHEMAFDMPGHGVYQWRMSPHGMRAPMPPRTMYMSPGDNDELRRELDDLKQEIRELKQKVGDRSDG